ncbi:MAG TPA: penicillin-binding protein activator, partial [Chromatiaceae bacterium]|nr:penicillin-binding protein activator [Chromatiaceae bacterium]
GWKELAALVRGFPNDPQGAAGPWHEWQALFPDHPALPRLLITYYQQQQKLAPAVIGRVAVLLPTNGRYAAAAEAIRNGILSAWYADTSEQRPHLRFYDSSDPEQVWPLLHQAADEGADLVVGPLTKPSVRQLARAGGLPLPVLALNQVNTDTRPPANLFQFGLAPEQEARQVALWAAARGLGKPGVLYPDTPWGERLYRAFQELWLMLGREPVRATLYHPGQGDYSSAVEELLLIRQAKSEHARREEEAGEKLPFNPELPVDFVFVVASGKEDLLQLRPLLMFHHASQLPVMTISRVWNGRLDPDEVLDLDGVMLPDIPWLVEEPTPQRPALSRQPGQTLSEG